LANIKSAIKRIRSSKRRAVSNKIVRTQTRSSVKDARTAIAAGDQTEIDAKLRAAASALDKAAIKGVVHKRNAARRKSRLMKAAAKAKTAK
jgi:small subunit ribosomal protein S20